MTFPPSSQQAATPLVSVVQLKSKHDESRNASESTTTTMGLAAADGRRVQPPGPRRIAAHEPDEQAGGKAEDEHAQEPNVRVPSVLLDAIGGQ